MTIFQDARVEVNELHARKEFNEIPKVLAAYCNRRLETCKTVSQLTLVKERPIITEPAWAPESPTRVYQPELGSKVLLLPLYMYPTIRVDTPTVKQGTVTEILQCFPRTLAYLLFNLKGASKLTNFRGAIYLEYVVNESHDGETPSFSMDQEHYQFHLKLNVAMYITGI